MDGKSLDVRAEKIAQLKTLFPEAFSENGINWQRLQLLLGEDTFAQGEHYELLWAGKTEARKEVQKQTTATLTPNDAFAEQQGSTNLFIEGENLEVLRILQKSYFGKVKMIYIDPPYNTGNDSFVYPDNYTEKQDEYRKRTGISNKQGWLNKQDFWKKNTRENGQFHSVWLSMMYPRLYLSRNLLTQDGVIFISIDDNEAANLKLLCDEIFGEENFVANYYWMRTSTPPSLSIKVRKKLETILCYQKAPNNAKFNGGTSEGGDMPLLNETNARKNLLFKKDSVFFKIKDGIYAKGLYDKVELLDDITIKNGKAINDFSLVGNFKWTQETLNKEMIEGTVFYVKTEKFAIRYQRLGERIKTPSNIISKTECNVGTNEDGVKNIEELFGISHFDYPKPVSLIKYLTNFCCGKNDIILDFFAGSGTTAQAVLELNEEDGGNRRFILVQMPEPTDPQSQAHQAGYTTIAHITKARINKVIEKLEKERAEKVQQKGQKQQTKIDATINQSTQNLSFATYSLADTNFNIWNSNVQGKEAIAQQLAAFRQSEKIGSQHNQLFVELCLKNGLELSIAYKKQQGFYKTEAGIWFCFEPYTPAMKDEIVAEKPQKVIFLSSCFAADQDISNLQIALQLSGTYAQFI